MPAYFLEHHPPPNIDAKGCQRYT